MAKPRNLFYSGAKRRNFRLEHLEARRLLAVALPTLPAIVAPASDPALPSGFDVFSPQGLTGSPASGSPGIAQWTESGSANDTIAVSITNPTALPAANQSSDTEFFTYGQTTASNGALVNDTIEQLGAGVASVNLSSANTGNSMYLLWAKNGDGYSSAVAINKADAWWVGPNQASAGQTVAVYGQNLTFSPTDGLSWVYVTQAGSSTGQWANVISANPYQVSFVVPTGLASGNYQVWVHNGHGGEYGWSNPMTLGVVAAAAFNGPVFNVVNFGAVGNGVTDDSAAFQAAMDAAQNSPGATVYVPTGNYVVSQFYLAANALLVGDGAGKSNILESPNATGVLDHPIVWLASNSQIENLTLDDNNTSLVDVVYGRFLSNVHFTGVTFNGDLASDVDIHGDQLVFFDNCKFIGDSSFLGTASQVFFDQCNFYATNDAGEMLYSWGGAGISITNCTVQDLDNSNPNSGAGWGQGRFFVGNDLWGDQSDTYIANNTTIALGPRPINGENQNSGEQLLWESGSLVSGGAYVGATANTVTYPGLGALGVGYNAIVVAGDGVGEYVPISSYNPTTGVITLAGTWAALPDSTSVIRVGLVIHNIAVYDNLLQGKGVTETASAGVEFWGTAINCVVDSNTISNTRLGINDVALDSGGNVMPAYFNLFQNNTITNAESGFWVENDGTSNEIGNVGSVFRFNHISMLSPGYAGILLRDYDYFGSRDGDTSGSPFYLIFEGNIVSSAPVALDVANFGTATTYLTLVDNTFSLGSAAAAGSIGLDVAQSLVLTQAGNSITGFAVSEGGSVTPTILSPIVAAPDTQFPPTTGLDGTTTSTLAGGSGSVTSGATMAGSSTSSTTGTQTTTNRSGKSKHKGGKQTVATPAAVVTLQSVPFAAATAIMPNLLKFPPMLEGIDAAVLSA
ncbi:MAG: glycosyl hydrolase family 28-related protein [Tepidisphaeraceae bacterium]|jgi:hypothetical protein